VQLGHQAGTQGAGGEERVVGQRPDLARVHRQRIAIVHAVGDAIEAEPVAAKFEARDLLTPVAREAHHLHEAGVQQVQVGERPAGLVDRVARAQQAALYRHRVGHQRQRLGHAAHGLRRFLIVRLQLGAAARGHGVRARGGRARGLESEGCEHDRPWECERECTQLRQASHCIDQWTASLGNAR